MIMQEDVGCMAVGTTVKNVKIVRAVPLSIVERLREQLKKEISSTSTWRFSDVNALINKFFGVEAKK